MDIDAKNITATFSPDRRFRYLWSLELEANLLRSDLSINFLLLNPSTADETRVDPTIKRCIARAGGLGARRVVITNLFAYRATDPKNLLAASGRGEEVIGAQNDEAIMAAATAAKVVIAGWGAHGDLLNRAASVKRALLDAGVDLYQLATTRTGQPRHPLYVPYHAKAHRLRA